MDKIADINAGVQKLREEILSMKQMNQEGIE